MFDHQDVHATCDQAVKQLIVKFLCILVYEDAHRAALWLLAQADQRA